MATRLVFTSEAEDRARKMGIRLTPRQRSAFRILEASGEKFLIHFGTKNCVERAKNRLPIWLPAKVMRRRL